MYVLHAVFHAKSDSMLEPAHILLNDCLCNALVPNLKHVKLLLTDFILQNALSWKPFLHEYLKRCHSWGLFQKGG